MEDSTLIWIGKTLFYILLFFIIFIASKFILKLRFSDVDVDNELTTKDNAAFSILLSGYFIGVLIIYCGVVQGEFYSYLVDTVLILFYGILGIGLLLISSIFNEKLIFGKKFSIKKEIFRDANNGTGFIEAANFIASALIIYGAINGKTLNLFPEMNVKVGLLISGVISLSAFWLIGQLILFVVLKLYTKFSKYNFYNEIQKDNNAVGIVYSSVLISVAYLYGQAIKGDLISWVATLENVAYYMVAALILLPISRFIVDSVILPKSKLTYEISQQEVPNQGAALIEAFAYIGSAILISYCI